MQESIAQAQLEALLGTTLVSAGSVKESVKTIGQVKSQWNTLLSHSNIWQGAPSIQFENNKL